MVILLRQLLGFLNISGLGGFVAPTEQDNQLIASLLEVYPIAWPVVNAQLTNPLPHRRNVAWKAVGEPKQASGDQCLGLGVLEALVPGHECVGLFDNHGLV